MAVIPDGWCVFYLILSGIQSMHSVSHESTSRPVHISPSTDGEEGVLCWHCQHCRIYKKVLELSEAASVAHRSRHVGTRGWDVQS